MRRSFICIAIASCFGFTSDTFAQSFGTELHNIMMPASGGMGA